MTAVLLCLAACENVPLDPAPVHVLNLGLRPDSASGAILVNRGETLYGIAQRYRLPLREIVDLNGLSPPYALADGQRLKLPPPADYTVRERDTLRSVSETFGVSPSQLASLNGLSAPYRLAQGQVLRLPMRHPELRVAPASTAAAAVPAAPVASVTSEALAPPAARRESGFIWPVRGKIVSDYGAKEGGLFNDGVNIAAPRGAAVVAAASGTVAYAGDGLKGYGNLVLIRHAGGMMTAYAHLGDIRVARGGAVRQGQTIGGVGTSGSVETPQVHFEIREGAKPKDPRGYLG